MARNKYVKPDIMNPWVIKGIPVDNVSIRFIQNSLLCALSQVIMQP